MEEHFATVWESVADVIGEHEAIVQGDTRRTWADFDDRAARLATALRGWGVRPTSKVGLLLYNCPEYIEAFSAALKLRAIPFNINFRYVAGELAYILDDSDAEILIYDARMRDTVEQALQQGSRLRALVEVGATATSMHAETSVECFDYEQIVGSCDPVERMTRSADDATIVYTGGTTGMPKGVVLRMGPQVANLVGSFPSVVGRPPLADVNAIPTLAASMAREQARYVSLPASPLMHNTGMAIGVLPCLTFGGEVVLLERPGFDASELWSVVERERVTAIAIVGDAFAKPMLDALALGPRDIASVRLVASAGVMFSAETKGQLLDAMPLARIHDIVGSTEAMIGVAVATVGNVPPTGRFVPSPGVIVIDDEGREVSPGSGVPGRVAVPGGAEEYYGDDAKSAATFREIGGRRYTIAGDHATVESDGSISFVGRGSGVINTGGEKVYAEEVEEVVKSHPRVGDALVFGVPDERFGARVVSLVESSDPQWADADSVIAHARGRLAGYKLPREIRFVVKIPRMETGKPDYAQARRDFGVDDSASARD